MKEFITALLALFIWSAAVFHADALCYGGDRAGWVCYEDNSGQYAIANAILLAQRNQQETEINIIRAQRGLPACSLAPLGFLVGKTPC